MPMPYWRKSASPRCGRDRHVRQLPLEFGHTFTRYAVCEGVRAMQGDAAVLPAIPRAVSSRGGSIFEGCTSVRPMLFRRYELTSLAPFLIVLLKLSGAILAWPRHLSTTSLPPLNVTIIDVFVPTSRYSSCSLELFQYYTTSVLRSRDTGTR
jgi:hypothetical protein